MIINVKTLAATGCMILGMAQTAEAQDLGLISFEQSGWSYIPVLDQGSVEAIVCLRNQDSLGTVRALWVEPDGAGAWIADAWESVSDEQVAAYVFDFVGASDEQMALNQYLDRWPIDLDPAELINAIQAPIQPTPFGDGVFIGDAIENVISGESELLEAFEAIGYPAVSSISGGSVSGGTFGGGSAGPPVRKDDECVAAHEFLNVLELAFESSVDDLDMVDLVFESELANLNTDCGCRERTWTLSDTGMVYTCGPWTQTGVTNSNPEPWEPFMECTYTFARPVTGLRTKRKKHRDEDCNITYCAQTKTSSFTQSRNTITIVASSSGCAPTGTPPTTTCACHWPTDTGFLGGGCNHTDWSPAECPWE